MVGLLVGFRHGRGRLLEWRWFLLRAVGLLQGLTQLHTVSENLEGWGHELTTGGASLALPTVCADFHCTGFTRTHDVASVAVLFVNPILPLDKQRSTSRMPEVLRRFAEYLVGIDEELVFG